jgi:hypothetical protein
VFVDSHARRVCDFRRQRQEADRQVEYDDNLAVNTSVTATGRDREAEGIKGFAHLAGTADKPVWCSGLPTARPAISRCAGLRSLLKSAGLRADPVRQDRLYNDAYRAGCPPVNPRVGMKGGAVRRNSPENRLFSGGRFDHGE